MEMTVMLAFLLGAVIGVVISVVLDKIRCNSKDAYGSFNLYQMKMATLVYIL